MSPPTLEFLLPSNWRASKTKTLKNTVWLVTEVISDLCLLSPVLR